MTTSPFTRWTKAPGRCAVLARGDSADEVLAAEPFEFGEGITGWAVEHRQPVLANRADLDPRVRFVEGTPPDPESLIAVPLIARGHLKGALNIYRVGLKEFTDEEFGLAVRFGDAVALALDNAHAAGSQFDPKIVEVCLRLFDAPGD